MNISTNYISKTVSSYFYYTPSAPCKPVYDHAYFKPCYCYYKEVKKKKSVPEYIGKTAEETTAWKKILNTLFPKIYIYIIFILRAKNKIKIKY